MTPDAVFFRVCANARNPERLFAVQSNKRLDVYAGHLPDGMQVLLGRTDTEKSLLVVFSEWGGLYDIRRKTLPPFEPPLPAEWNQAADEVALREYLHKEIGFEPGVVRVRQFLVADDECGFWVGPLPWHFNQILAELESYTAEEHAEYRELIRGFIARGSHVLDWANNWRILDADGADAG